jgi:hypothetical protein
MVPEPTRRALLRGGSVLAATAFAGCSALPGGGSGDPDAGTDSYGVRVENRTERTQTVAVTVRPRGGSETVFEETVEVAAGGTREWDRVLTEDGQYLVKAVVDAEHFLTASDNNVRTVSVGAPNSYDAENVTVRLASFDEVEGVSAQVIFEGRA